MTKKNISETLKIILNQKDKQIEYCKNEIDILQNEKGKLIKCIEEQNFQVYSNKKIGNK